MLLRPQDSRVEEARLHRLGLRSWASSHVQGSGGAAVRRCGGAAVRRWSAHRLLPRGLCEQLCGGRVAQVVVGKKKHTAL